MHIKLDAFMRNHPTQETAGESGPASRGGPCLVLVLKQEGRRGGKGWGGEGREGGQQEIAEI